MEKERLLAFTDGVIAVIITIMVLEMKVPQDATLGALEHRAICVGSIQCRLAVGCRDFHRPVGILLCKLDRRVQCRTAGKSEFDAKGLERRQATYRGSKRLSQEPDHIGRQQHPKEGGDRSDNVRYLVPGHEIKRPLMFAEGPTGFNHSRNG